MSLELLQHGFLAGAGSNMIGSLECGRNCTPHAHGQQLMASYGLFICLRLAFRLPIPQAQKAIKGQDGLGALFVGFTNRIPAMQACVLPSIGQHAPIPNADTPISVSVAMELDMGLQRAKPEKATHRQPVSNPHTTHTRQPACRFGNLCVCCLACTPVKISPLLALLEQYPPRAQAEKLQTGFTQGFRLGFIGPRIGRDAPNLQSVRQRTQMAPL